MITDKDFVEETYQKLQTSLTGLKTEVTRKGLKEFRVAIKRLRAFAMLADYIGKNDEEITKHSKALKQFKPVFRASGGLRDTELSIKFLEKFEELVRIQCYEYKAFMNSETEAYQEDFEEAFAQLHSPTLIKVSKQILDHLKKLDEAYVLYRSSLWLNSKYQEYEYAIKHIACEEDIHNIRKLLKQLYFILELTGLKMENEDSQLKQRLKHIGKWHDRTIFRDKMSEYLLNTEDEIKKYYRYTRLLERIEKEAQEHLNEAKIKFINHLNN